MRWIVATEISATAAEKDHSPRPSAVWRRLANRAPTGLLAGGCGPRDGRSGQPHPTAHFGPFAHSQCAMAVTSAAMPSHLWRRYILSSPPSPCSGQRGRMASIIATLMQAIASAPLYCTAALRIAKKQIGREHVGRAHV